MSTLKTEDDKQVTIELVENVTTLSEVLDMFKTKFATEQTPNVFGSHYLSYRIPSVSCSIDVVYTNQNHKSHTHTIHGDGKDVINLHFNDSVVIEDKGHTTERVLVRVDIVNDNATRNQYYS